MHCMDPINKEINQIFTIFSQIKEELTKLYFSATQTFASHLYCLQRTYIFDFGQNLDHPRCPKNHRFLHSFLTPLRAQNRF